MKKTEFIIFSSNHVPIETNSVVGYESIKNCFVYSNSSKLWYKPLNTVCNWNRVSVECIPSEFRLQLLLINGD